MQHSVYECILCRIIYPLYIFLCIAVYVLYTTDTENNEGSKLSVFLPISLCLIKGLNPLKGYKNLRLKLSTIGKLDLNSSAWM